MDIDKLLVHTLEIEGALRVLHFNDSPEARALLDMKVASFNQAYRTLCEATPAATTEDATAEVAEDKDETTTSYIEDATAPVTTSSSFGDAATAEAMTYKPCEVQQAQETTEQADTAAFVIDEEPSGSINRCNTDSDAEAEKTGADGIGAAGEADAITPEGDTPDMQDGTDGISAAADGKGGGDTVATVGESAPHVTLNDTLAKSFTLNDRFRFITELFNGDTEDFDETVKLLADMPNVDEARDYLCNDLMWDGANPTVAEFINIISRHIPR